MVSIWWRSGVAALRRTKLIPAEAAVSSNVIASGEDGPEPRSAMARQARGKRAASQRITPVYEHTGPAGAGKYRAGFSDSWRTRSIRSIYTTVSAHTSYRARIDGNSPREHSRSLRKIMRRARGLLRESKNQGARDTRVDFPGILSHHQMSTSESLRDAVGYWPIPACITSSASVR
jgi:hypothetical protein